MLLVVDILGIERGVVKKYLHAIRARLFQAAHRPVVKQVTQTSRPGLVVSGFSYARSNPAFLARRLDQGNPHWGSSRMALAWGVSTL